MQITEAIAKYLKHKETEIKQASVINYARSLQKFANFFNKPFEAINEDDLDDFKLSVKNKYAPAHYSMLMIVVKDFIKFCRLREFSKLNEYFIKVPRYKTNPHQTITFEEFNKLCDSLSENNFNDLTKKLIIKMLWWTGMRVSELCELDISQIDTKKREIQIQAKKSNRLRLISWSQDTHDLLCKYLGVRLCINCDPALFTNGKDRITCRSVQRWTKEVCKKAGITKKISPHSFRHGIIHFLKSLGVSAEDVQGYVGHTNVVSTIQNYMVWDYTELTNFRGKIENLVKEKMALKI